MHIAVADGSVRRVCQLTGEWDRAPGRDPLPALNRTESRTGLVGTDLGSSFFDGDRLWFLFGDSWPDPALHDAVAWTRDTDPDNGLSLTFVTDSAGRWKPPTVARAGRSFSTGVFEVPTGGFAADGRNYVIYTSDFRMDGADVVMGSSALCRPRNNGDDLTDLEWVFDLSIESNSGRFINAAPVVTQVPPVGLPFAGPAVLVWGSGRYRRSHAYLAAVPAQRALIEDSSAWWYYAETRPDGSPRWVKDQYQAGALFPPPAGQPDGGIGELSAMWVGPLGVWLLSYTSQHIFGAVFRTAPHPWGPWSRYQLLHDPNSPTVGFGHLMHLSWDVGGPQGTDLLYDRGRGPEGGAPYAPYLVDRFTRPAGVGGAQIWFALSSWNPYQASLMTARLEQQRGSLELPPASAVLDDRTPARVGRAVHVGESRVDEVQTAHERVAVTPADEHLLLPALPTGGLAMVQSRFGPRNNNFELVVPALTGGIIFTAATNDPWPPAWGQSVVVGRGGGAVISYDAVSIALSDANDGPSPDTVRLDRRRDRLIVAAVTGGRLVYLTRDRQPPWEWSGPYPVIAVELDDRRYPLAGIRGNAALIASTYGRLKTNFELMVADATSGIRHYWFDNDPVFPLNGDWRLAPTFGQSLGRLDAVTVTQSVFGDPERGNLEVLARRGAELHLLWRDESLTWQGPFPLIADGSPVTTADGIPHLVQSKYGANGRDFHLVTPHRDGGLVHLWRDNSAPDPADWHWYSSPVIDVGTQYLAAALVEGPFGPAPGNLELVATTASGTVRHFWREATDPQWHDAGQIPI